MNNRTWYNSLPLRTAVIAMFIAAVVHGVVIKVECQTVSGQQVPSIDSALATQETETRNYKVGPGDVVDVSVSNNEKLSRTGVRVRNDGTIQLEMLSEDIAAACLTERELADTIREKYRKYLVSPYVTVAVKEFNASPVAVIGAVNAPGRFQLQRQYRLIELLALVNGPGATAGTDVEILRHGSIAQCDGARLVQPKERREELITIRLDDAFNGVDGANPIIVAGDIVRVTTADQINAYIQGLVRNSAPIPLREAVTLTQAIAMAGGVMPGAQLDKVVIRRPIPGSINRTDLLVNVKEIKQGKRDDVLLQRNDIVEVPGPTGAKKIFSEIMKTIIPTITQMPMRVVY